MSWLPPRKVATRREWSYAHPWLAGCYFAILWFAFWYVALVLQSRAQLALVLGVVTAVPMGLLVAISAKRRVGGRLDADRQPITGQRLWGRRSDRFVAGTLILAVVVGAVSIISLALPGRSLTDVVGAIAGVWLAADAAAERRLRRRST
jgi:hypothetical protein